MPAQHADRRLKRALAGMRAAAAEDRAAAAEDRERAAEDRALAAADRRQARVDVARAHVDELTGIYTRGLGQETLRHEIDRANRVGEPFTLAFLTLTGSRPSTTARGTRQGTTSFVRSPTRYGPSCAHTTRSSGWAATSSCCGFSGTDAVAAEERVAEIHAALAESHPETTISVGVAESSPTTPLTT